MTYVAKSEYCCNCGGWHPRYIEGCPELQLVDNPIILPQIQLAGMDVDITSNIRGTYNTLYFKCPQCEDLFVLLNSNYCHQCGIKLNWK